jgi:zinc transporter ZupT
LITAPRAITFGVGIGIVGALGQFWLIRLNTPQTAPLRGLITLAIAVLIGTIAGLLEKKEALKLAALMGFVAGVFISAVGVSILIRNPSLLGDHPFSSAESTLTFMSSVMAGIVTSSWLISGVAVLVALPISLLQQQRISDDPS